MTWLQTKVPAVCDTEAGIPRSRSALTIALIGKVLNHAAGPPSTIGVPHRDNQLRLQVLYRRVERRQRLAKYAGKLPGGHRLASNHSAVKLLHHFPGRVHRLAVKGFETGE